MATCLVEELGCLLSGFGENGTSAPFTVLGNYWRPAAAGRHCHLSGAPTKAERTEGWKLEGERAEGGGMAALQHDEQHSLWFDLMGCGFSTLLRLIHRRLQLMCHSNYHE